MLPGVQDDQLEIRQPFVVGSNAVQRALISRRTSGSGRRVGLPRPYEHFSDFVIHGRASLQNEEPPGPVNLSSAVHFGTSTSVPVGRSPALRLLSQLGGRLPPVERTDWPIA
jgi:hypothetical protein